MLGILAQAIDEGIPDGATGFQAAEAVVKFLNDAGYVIVSSSILKFDPAPMSPGVFMEPRFY